MMIELAAHILTPWAMFALWFGVTLLGVVMAWRLHLTALHISAGALPWAVFYLWTAMGWWGDTQTAVAYSRFAGAFLAINLMAGLLAVCRLACERGRLWKQR